MNKTVPLLAAATLLASAALARPTAPAPAAPAAAPDLAKGKAQFARCQSCHSIDPAAQRGIGPNLAKVIGRPAGKLPGAKYSASLAAAKFAWTPEKLDAFLTKPRQVVPGTTMVFAGMPDAEARRALIAYLAAGKK